MKLYTKKKLAKKFIICLSALLLLDYILGIGATKNVAMFSKYHIIYAAEIVTGPQVKALLSFDNEKAVNIFLDELDERFLEKFYEDGGNIHVLSRDEYEKETGRTSNACYIDSTKSIYSSTSNADPSVIHELGHYLDCTLELYKEPELQHIIEAEGKYLEAIRPHAEESDREYIADAFMYYIVWPNTLALVAPETYEYIDNIYNNFIEER